MQIIVATGELVVAVGLMCVPGAEPAGAGVASQGINTLETGIEVRDTQPLSILTVLR